MTFRTAIVLSDRLRDFGEVWIGCPTCNRESPYKIGRVRHNPTLTCPTCWASFVVEIATDNSADSRRVK